MDLDVGIHQEMALWDYGKLESMCPVYRGILCSTPISFAMWSVSPRKSEFQKKSEIIDLYLITSNYRVLEF